LAEEGVMNQKNEYDMKTKCVLFAMAMATTLAAQEQKTLSSRTVFKLSPQHFFVSTLQIGTERFNHDFTRSWNVSVGVRSQGSDRTHSTVIRGAEVDLQYRRYVRPMQPYTSRKNRTYLQGVYIGPFVNGGYFNVDDEHLFMNWGMGGPNWQGHGNVYNSLQFAGGFTIGMQRTFWDVIVLDVFAGGGVRHSSIDMVSNRFDDQPMHSLTWPGFSGIFPRIGFNIGIAL
jgi:hypothetical protein